MEWTSSTDFLTLLKRFPYTKITARHHRVTNLGTKQVWEYHDDTETFVQYRKIKGKELKEKELTEEEFLNLYVSDDWRPESFFFLTDEKQKALAVRIVEHLITTGNLGWIIWDCNIEFVRECQHCHKLMTEGWARGEDYTYCSDECLLKDNPDISPERLEEDEDEYPDLYSMEWED